MIIKELSPHLANLIAAGEVVERPASVAKELIENAIDAGATRIQVEIENGGITYLRIMDNGCGMTKEDAPVAFKRHATSKISTEDDLSKIGTLGFRGEALAAIASVSRIDLFTKKRESLVGLHLHLEAGKITENEEAGCPDGTTIIIRDLFFNTPARMKFLKKDFTEAGYIISVVEHAALSHPEISFSMIRDGKQVFATSGDNKLITPVFSVFGREITSNMIEISKFERGNITVWGYITKPHLCRPNRSMQHFFVNGRYIKSKLMGAALEEAYKNQIITGKYPSCALFIDLPLNLVDVNVHPAKTEVKFAEEKPVFEAIYIACKNALEQNDNIPVLNKKPKEDNITGMQQVIEPKKPKVQEEIKKEPIENPIFKLNKVKLSPVIKPPIIDCDDDFDTPVNEVKVCSPVVDMAKVEYKTETVIKAKPEIKQEVKQEIKPSAKVIGEAFKTYIIAEDKDGFILLDKHAAHERILFNELKKTTQIPVQQLLTPYIAEMNINEFEVLQENRETLSKLGFDISVFGEKSFAVRAVPAYIDMADITVILSEIAEKLSNYCTPTPDEFDDLIHTVACKAAIKAGKATTQMEMQKLFDKVSNDNEVNCCPHGRPVMVRLTKYEIDKLFKRVNQ
ncbi:MAG TPA: DNA mismatch repair endonuclease MutL [Candidatus Butyricicoccus avistercoris]|uniref:DNA mismatch repair protein MutL n=1 Tax=Candidatus Butyricicoccus avistercoris TaxID=2838518 RepID=A0A9D1TIN9_9FIRM|nr:DNA mismatch repair endonuclease MutL [Candidatus Butyricicoccus avistercoris]